MAAAAETLPINEPPPLRILGDGVVRVRAAPLGVAVVDDLVTAIVTGEIAPGDVLPAEGALSQRFAVSRTVIRESVKRVEEKGLVTASQGRGTAVNPPSRWNVLDPHVLSALIDHDDTLDVLDEIAIVRASLEATMACAAAARRTAERNAELRAAFDTANAAFHHVVMEQSGIRLAANITRTMLTRARESTRFTGSTTNVDAYKSFEEHRAVLEAIVAGDGDMAATAMREHIANAWSRRRSRGDS
jgi:DNA-binding FadR family transcriptional regulator